MRFEMDTLAAMWRIDGGWTFGETGKSLLQSSKREILVDWTMEMSVEREHYERGLTRT